MSSKIYYPGLYVELKRKTKKGQRKKKVLREITQGGRTGKKLIALIKLQFNQANVKQHNTYVTS